MSDHRTAHFAPSRFQTRVYSRHTRIDDKTLEKATTDGHTGHTCTMHHTLSHAHIMIHSHSRRTWVDLGHAQIRPLLQPERGAKRGWSSISSLGCCLACRAIASASAEGSEEASMQHRDMLAASMAAQAGCWDVCLNRRFGRFGFVFWLKRGRKRLTHAHRTFVTPRSHGRQEHA